VICQSVVLVAASAGLSQAQEPLAVFIEPPQDFMVWHEPCPVEIPAKVSVQNWAFPGGDHYINFFLDVTPEKTQYTSKEHTYTVPPGQHSLIAVLGTTSGGDIPESKGVRIVIVECGCLWNGTCDDGDPCTTDECVDDLCVFEPYEGPCDDGDPTTTGDSCAWGVCSGSPIPPPPDTASEPGPDTSGPDAIPDAAEGPPAADLSEIVHGDLPSVVDVAAPGPDTVAEPMPAHLDAASPQDTHATGGDGDTGVSGATDAAWPGDIAAVSDAWAGGGDLPGAGNGDGGAAGGGSAGCGCALAPIAGSQSGAEYLLLVNVLLCLALRHVPTAPWRAVRTPPPPPR
jgi:hypothetical protein